MWSVVIRLRSICPIVTRGKRPTRPVPPLHSRGDAVHGAGGHQGRPFKPLLRGLQLRRGALGDAHAERSLSRLDLDQTVLILIVRE